MVGVILSVAVRAITFLSVRPRRRRLISKRPDEAPRPADKREAERQIEHENQNTLRVMPRDGDDRRREVEGEADDEGAQEHWPYPFFGFFGAGAARPRSMNVRIASDRDGFGSG